MDETELETGTDTDLQEKYASSGFKRFFKKVFSWIKAHFFELVTLVSIVLIATFLVRSCEKDQAYQTLFDQYSESIKDNQSQIELIKKLQEEERVQRTIQIDNFIREINKIQEKYQEDLARIEATRKKSQRQIVDDARSNPNTLTEKIREIFGIPVE